MARIHNVEFTIPKRPVGNADIEFEVKRHGAKLGSLKISRGVPVWTPANYQLGYKLRWTRPGELFEEYGTRE